MSAGQEKENHMTEERTAWQMRIQDFLERLKTAETRPLLPSEMQQRLDGHEIIVRHEQAPLRSSAD